MEKYTLDFMDTFISPVLDNGVSKVVKFSFAKGKELQKHRTTSDILVIVMEGRIRFHTNEEVLLERGDMISLGKMIEHSILALEDSIVILILTPSPNYHSIMKP